MLARSSHFLSSKQPCKPKSLDVALNITVIEKIPSENLCLCSTERPFDSSFEWKERHASATVEIFVLCGWRFSNPFDIVLETHFSCSKVGCELWLAILCSLLCPETNGNIRMCFFLKLILRSDVFTFHSWHEKWVNAISVRLGKVDFF